MSSIKKDEKVKQFLDSIELTIWDNILKEADSLHTTRTSRSLFNLKSATARKIIEAAMLDMSYRSRLVEILVTVKRKYAIIESGIETIGNYLQHRYPLKFQEFRTIAQREAFINSTLEKAWKCLNDMDIVIDSITLIIEDIDKSSYSLKHALDGLELTTKKGWAV